jgi:hypothetical protein
MKKQLKKPQVIKIFRFAFIFIGYLMFGIIFTLFLKSKRDCRLNEQLSHKNDMIEFLSVLYSCDSVFSAKHRLDQSLVNFSMPIVSIQNSEHRELNELRSKEMSYNLAAFREMPYEFYQNKPWFVRLVINPSFRYPYLIRLVPEDDKLMLSVKKLPWSNHIDHGSLEAYEYILETKTHEELLDTIMLLQNFRNEKSESLFSNISDGDTWLLEIRNRKGKYHNVYHHVGTKLDDEKEFLKLCNGILSLAIRAELPDSIRNALEFYMTYDYSKPMSLPF